MVEKAISAIEQQQEKVDQRSPVWMVGDQLKDICQNEPECAEILWQDLQVEKMSIVEAEKKIKAFADSIKKGNFACVTPLEADRILREFYGLPERIQDSAEVVALPVQEAVPTIPVQSGRRRRVDLADFF